MSLGRNGDYKVSDLPKVIFYFIFVAMLLGVLVSNKIADMSLKYKFMVNKQGRVTLTKALLKEDFSLYLVNVNHKMMYLKVVLVAVLCAYILSWIYMKMCDQSGKKGLTSTESFYTIESKPQILVIAYILVMILINTYSFKSFLVHESFNDTDVKTAVINQDDYEVLTDMDYDNNYTYSITLSNGITCDVRNKLFKRVKHPGEYYFAYIKSDEDSGIVFGIYPASEFEYDE